MLYTFYDVETSGLEKGCDVLSFSYMLADENLVVKKAETLYFWKEGVTQWTEGAYAINGLSKEFLRGYADQYETNLKKMYIAMSYGDLVGYNSGYVGAEGLIKGYDFPVCKSFLLRNGLYEPTVLGFYDVMHMCGQIYKHRWKLQKEFEVHGLSRELADAYMGIYFGTEGHAHESAYDVVCTAMLFQSLYEAGHISRDNQASASFLADIEERGIGEYKIAFDGNGLIVIQDTYEDVEISAADFSAQHPKLFDTMMENPSVYM